MLSQQEKEFFISITRGAESLSGGGIKEGALIIYGRRILSYGCHRTIDNFGKWGISAIYDALFGARDINLIGAILFSTRFPKSDELKLIVSCGIKTLYFLGEVNDVESVQLANDLPKSGIEFEIIKLQEK